MGCDDEDVERPGFQVIMPPLPPNSALKPTVRTHNALSPDTREMLRAVEQVCLSTVTLRFGAAGGQCQEGTVAVL